MRSGREGVLKRGPEPRSVKNDECLKTRSGREVNLKQGGEIMRSEKDVLKRGPENR
jgi:hypothetical protein